MDWAALNEEVNKVIISNSTPIKTQYIPRNTEKAENSNAKQTDTSIQDTETEDVSKEIADDVGYSVEISSESAKKTKDLNEELQKMSEKLKAFKEQLENVKEQADGAAEQWKVYTRCLRIAMHIMSGDIVTKEDHRYLAKNDPELYSKAVSMRMEKTDPKKIKRISEDEKPDKNSDKDDENSTLDSQLKIQDEYAGDMEQNEIPTVI